MLPQANRTAFTEDILLVTEFAIPTVGWVPIDASEAAKDPGRRKYFFGAIDEHRVEFSKGRDLV